MPTRGYHTELLFGKVPGQLGVGFCIGDVKTRFKHGTESVSDVEKEALIVLLAVIPISVLRKVGEASVVVNGALDTAGGDLATHRTKTAVLQPNGQWGGIISGWGNKIDGSAECCAAQL